jgi:hypothetical protein
MRQCLQRPEELGALAWRLRDPLSRRAGVDHALKRPDTGVWRSSMRDFPPGSLRVEVSGPTRSTQSASLSRLGGDRARQEPDRVACRPLPPELGRRSVNATLTVIRAGRAFARARPQAIKVAETVVATGRVPPHNKPIGPFVRFASGGALSLFGV